MKIKKIAVFCTAAALAFSAFAVGLAMYFKISNLEHENIAKNFSKDTTFSQITLYIPKDQNFNADKVMYFRYKLENKLTEKSITPVNEYARLYADAFIAYSDETLTPASKYTSTSSVSAKVAFVGGDYGLFYPELADKPRVTDDVNHDRILLSKSAAWRLFGGYKLYDFEIESGGKPYYVSGVFDDYTSDEYTQYLGDKALCIADIMGNPEMPIGVYHIIVVNPVKNFAMQLVKECIDLPDGSYYIVENSSRFSIANLFKQIPRLTHADKQLPAGVVITPNEALAQRSVKELSLMLAILIILAFFPTIVLIFLLYKLIKLIKKLLNKYIFDKIRDKLSYS